MSSVGAISHTIRIYAPRYYKQRYFSCFIYAMKYLLTEMIYVGFVKNKTGQNA
jgi:hypothetical protein